MKTIINLFHPNFKQSRVNKRLADQVKGEFEVRNLAELYPDFMIDVKKEQQVWPVPPKLETQLWGYFYDQNQHRD